MAEDELARFREEWKREVEQRRHPQPAPNSAATTGHATGSSSGKAKLLQKVAASFEDGFAEAEPLPGPSSETVAGPGPGSVSTSTFFKNTVIPASVRNALSLYRRAIEHETRGEHDESAKFYRQAFRIEPDVEKIYASWEKLAAVEEQEATLAEEEQDTTKKREEALVVKSSSKSADVVTGFLAKIIREFPPDVRFMPEDEKLPVQFNVLPEELLVAIIRRLDHTTIERFAAVSRKARILTLDSTVWREFVALAYKPPQIPSFESIVPVVAKYKSDFRRIYMEHPRLRLDGVYISVCHYVRPGLSENQWVNISHLISYHRYLRFFPDGKVLSLLANEEAPPGQVIHTLKLSLRKKGLFIGTWRLSGSTVAVSNLIDASGRYPIPPMPNADEGSFARYAFRMTLSLVSRPVGRWNKLELTQYDSVDLESGDVSPLPLKRERPFWFSKVRSFPAY
uniref:F-box domain-containing protein n=1 Tax=Mycena chlorophos TaxID=658473 RepID=A0ABQ0L3M2_MYCCL|nr:predicted protein [Mycena chlorophos]